MDTIVRNVVLVVNKAMSIVTEGERVHAWEDRVRIVVSSAEEMITEVHAARKFSCMMKTVVKVCLVVVPDCP